MSRDVSAVVLAYLEEPWLAECIDSLLSSRGVDAEVVLVDNGCTDGAVDRLSQRDRLKVIRPGRNLGFAGGCNFGASHASGEVIAFVNSDAIVDPDALARLAEVAARPGVGLATASIRLADDPEVLNTAGNPLHFLGVGWSGGFGEPADAYKEEREVAGASGAGMAVRREVWERLGGFEDRFFAYHEDADLSLRCWQQGLKVMFVPEAVVFHHYEFSRNPGKFYLLERNRLILLFTLFEARTLVAITPPLLIYEIATLVAATIQGWWREKIGAWWSMVSDRKWIGERRRRLQRERRVPDRAIAYRLEGRLRPGNYSLPAFLRPFDWLFAAYWSMVRRILFPS